MVGPVEELLVFGGPFEGRSGGLALNGGGHGIEIAGSHFALVFNSRETADNLKKSGGFIPGIRPGDQTAKFIDKILLRLTLAGAVYITFVCLVPEFLILKYNVPFYFGGTSLLIIVVVTMDFMAQVQNYMMSQQYESLLKKANFKTTLG